MKKRKVMCESDSEEEPLMKKRKSTCESESDGEGQHVVSESDDDDAPLAPASVSAPVSTAASVSAPVTTAAVTCVAPMAPASAPTPEEAMFMGQLLSLIRGVKGPQ